MNKVSLVLIFLGLIVFFIVGSAMVITLGDNITLFDKMTGGTGWHGAQEDQEVEPNCVTGQGWEPEGLNLWEYFIVGTSAGRGSFVSNEGLISSDVDGLDGGTHYAMALDLSFPGTDVSLAAYNTVEYGNDNLMGRTTATFPEGVTMLLLGTGLICLAGLGRIKFSRKA